MKSKMLESALYLSEQGFKVFPVNQEKKPLILDWNKDSATTDPALIEEWWGGRFADANVGISCGPSDLVVMDVDPRHNGNETVAEWQRHYDTGFTKTVTSQTGGDGNHYYFAANGGRYQSPQGTIGAGIDIRATSSFVVAPYSIHQNGKPYVWDSGYAPTEHEILPLPEWLAELIPLAKPERAKIIRANKVKEQGIRASRDIPTCPNLLIEEITGDILHSLDADIFFANAAAHFLGMPFGTELGEGFHCLLPGHSDTKPSASFGRHDAGHYYYKDFHHGNYGSPDVLTFAEVYAAQMTGRVQKLNKSSHTTWKIRMLVEMGMLQPALVELRSLPQHASKTVQKVYEGFRLLLQCKWRYAYGAPTAFSWSFAAGWCDVAEDTAARAFKALQAMKIVQETGSYSGAYGKKMKEFLPYPA
jgi:hypothetical protein